MDAKVEHALGLIRKRIRELEEELEALKTIYAELAGADPGEYVEDVVADGETIARVYIGEDYVRMMLLAIPELSEETKKYLEEKVRMIRDAQRMRGENPEATATILYPPDPSSWHPTIMIEGLHGVDDVKKAKSALEYAALTEWDLRKEV